MNKRIVKVVPPKMKARPICPGCGKRLRPWMMTLEYGSSRPGNEKPEVVQWNGSYHSYGEFCMLRCATAFANRVVKQIRAMVHDPAIVAKLGVRS